MKKRQITLDFETYSEADVMKVGAYKYAEHESTEITHMTFSIDGDVYPWSPYFPFFDDPSECPEELREAIEAGYLVEAHNSGFERCMYNEKLVKKFGWPVIDFSKWRCSAAKGSAAALPRSLEGLGAALRLPVQKNMKGNRVMKQYAKPRKPTKHDDSIRHSDPLKFATIMDYNIDDVKVEEMASDIVRDLSPNELRIWQLDQIINDRGIFCDVPLVKKALAFTEKYVDELTAELIEITDGEVTTANQIKRICEFMADEGVYIMSLAKDNVEEWLKKDLPLKARRVLEIRLALAKSSTKKLKRMIECACVDSRIRGTLLYHGAATGRWSGKLIQVHNFPRGTLKDIDECLDVLESETYETFRALYPNVLSAISSCLRGMLCASPGKKLLQADFSAVESRVLFWLTDCPSGLKAYRTHGKIYEDMAGTIYNRSRESIGEKSFERQLGKQAVLGCGFQMGHKKFKITCEGYGINIDKDLALLAVNAYRDKYPEVKKFWNIVENAAIKAVNNPGRVVACAQKRIKFKVEGHFLYCMLPSGRLLSYCEPEIQSMKTPWGEMKNGLTYMGVDSKTKKWIRRKSYGGHLTENIVQAISRDLMVESMFRVEEKEYPLLMTVHDELVAEVKENFGSVREFENLMAGLPKWAKGCPVKVKGFATKRFKK